MTPDMWLTLAILAIAIVLFITEKLRVDVVALGVVVALLVTGILDTSEALAGFSSTAVILIIALFIVGGAVFQTGLANRIGDSILRIAGTSELRLLVTIMVAVSAMSGFISSTGVVALMLPAIMSLARTTKIPPSRLLIPLAFGSLLGGATTLIGTPPNIIINDVLMADANYTGFSFFDFTPIALLLIVTSILFMALFGRRLLPDRRPPQDEQQMETPTELLESYRLPDNIYKIRVRKASPLIDKTISETGMGHDYNINILEISRPAPPRTVARFGEQELVVQSKQNIPVHPRPDTVLQRDDILLVRGEGNDVGRAAATLHLAIQPRNSHDYESLISQEVGVAELVLPPRSSLIDKTLMDVRFGTTYRLTVLDVRRPDQKEPLDLKNTKLRLGDTLLVQGRWKDILALKKQRRDFIIIGETDLAQFTLNFGKAPIALLILFGMLVLLVTGDSIGISATTAALLAALATVLTGCLSMDEAYESIDWKSVVLIAGMLPMSTALTKVGLVDMIANGVTGALGGLGPLAVMAAFFLLTALLTQVLSNTATTVLLAPIALAAAMSLGVEPHAFLLSVAFAASMAFASPIASPVNTLVMGPGNYRFSDYFRVGIPMVILAFIVTMIALPILWPF